MKADQLILRLRRLSLTASRLGLPRAGRYCWEKLVGLGPARQLIIRRGRRRPGQRDQVTNPDRVPSPFGEGHRASWSEAAPVVHGAPVHSPATAWQRKAALDDFHVHYLHWLLPLDPAEQQRWLDRWLTDHSEPDTSAAWHPYVVATRTQALLALDSRILEKQDLDRRVSESLRWNREIMRLRSERALGGNHLIRDLQAQVALSRTFNDGHTLSLAREFIDELEQQLFSDGVHTERSPSYHGVVLGDALQVFRDIDDIDDIDEGGSLTDRLLGLIERMRRALVELQHCDASLPRFNDSPTLDPRYVMWLQSTPARAANLGEEKLSDSGFRVLSTPDLRLVVDAGPPSPDYLPGHAHAEIGSFELSTRADGVLLRNVGTSVYQPGERRAYERSTSAHTTMVIGQQSQTELWSSFRMGRIPSVHRQESDQQLKVRHDGYRGRLPGNPSHIRTFTTNHDGSIDIRDVITSETPVQASLSLFTAHCKPVVSDSSARIGRLQLDVELGQFEIRSCQLAAAMNETAPGWELLLSCDHASNHDICVTLSVTSDLQSPAGAAL